MRRLLVLVLILGCRKPQAPPSPVVEAEEDFEPFVAGDWQKRFEEEAQTYEDYAGGEVNRKSAPRHTLYIQPLGELSRDYHRTIEIMRDYAEIFFGVTAKIRDPLPMFLDGYVKSRRQYNATMLSGQLAERLPEDAIVYIGITDRDLFSKGLNFVFGEANLRNRTGMYSLCRYATSDKLLFLRRALKLLTHESGHIFSIHHCITFKCVMNGANSLEEDDSHPMHLCPIDLRKLQWNVGFDSRARYRKLRDFYEEHGLTAEAEWTAKHLEKLGR